MVWKNQNNQDKIIQQYLHEVLHAMYPTWQALVN